MRVLLTLLAPAPAPQEQQADWLGLPVQVWTPIGALAGALLALLGVLVTAWWGPAWKSRHEQRRLEDENAAAVVSTYAEPLAAAAYDLQSRLYNVITDRFLAVHGAAPSGAAPSYAEASTLWIFGQYFAWTEIVRREIQVLRVGSNRRTASLARLMARVEWVLLTDSLHGPFRIWKQDQRAIGQLMVVSTSVGGRERSDCLAYADFVRLVEAVPPGQPGRRRLFRAQQPPPVEEDHRAGDLRTWLQPLRRDLRELRSLPPVGPGGAVSDPRAERLAFVQRALVDLIQELDPEAVRFPRELRQPVEVTAPEPAMLRRLAPVRPRRR